MTWTLDIMVLTGGLIAGAIYVGMTLQERKQPDVGKAVNAVLSGSGIPAGVYLVVCAFRPELLKDIAGLGLYIAIGGLATALVSSYSLFAVYRPESPTRVQGETSDSTHSDVVD